MTYLRDFVRYAVPVFVGLIGGSMLIRGDYMDCFLVCMLGIYLSLFMEPIIGKDE